MRETPNKDNPQADVEFVVQELLDLYNEANPNGAIDIDDNCIELRSHVGSTFHARVMNAAQHLGLIELSPLRPAGSADLYGVEKAEE